MGTHIRFFSIVHMLGGVGGTSDRCFRGRVLVGGLSRHREAFTERCHSQYAPSYLFFLILVQDLVIDE